MLFLSFTPQVYRQPNLQLRLVNPPLFTNLLGPHLHFISLKWYQNYTLRVYFCVYFWPQSFHPLLFVKEQFLMTDYQTINFIAYGHEKQKRYYLLIHACFRLFTLVFLLIFSNSSYFEIYFVLSKAKRD